jgi:hypothetical protein
MPRTTTATLYRELRDGTEAEIPVTVAYTVPDESYADVESVEDDAGRPVETTPAEDERLAAECLEAAKEEWRSAREP